MTSVILSGDHDDTTNDTDDDVKLPENTKSISFGYMNEDLTFKNISIDY